MKIGICSGYFQRFHSGHKEYIQKAVNCFDAVIVIVNNTMQQNIKYNSFENIRPVQDIIKIITTNFPDVIIKVAIDTDSTVCETLKELRLNYLYENLYFCKDGDRNKKNIPEYKILKELKIKYKQFKSRKIGSSTNIMLDEIGFF